MTSRDKITCPIPASGCWARQGCGGLHSLELDDLDLDIVRILSDDGRASYSEMSKALGVSVGTVRNRVNQMRDTGMLYFNVWLDPHRSGIGVIATLLLRVQAGCISDVTSTLIDLVETGYVATLAGGHDLLTDVFCRDAFHLSRLVHDEIQTIEGVIEVRCYLVTDIKYESSLNIRGVINKSGEPGSGSGHA